MTMKLWQLLEDRDSAARLFNSTQRALSEVLGDEGVGLYAWYRGHTKSHGTEILFVAGKEACLDWGQGWPEHEIHQYDGIVIIPKSANADPESYAPRDLIVARLYPCIVNTRNYAAALAWLKEHEL